MHCWMHLIHHTSQAKFVSIKILSYHASHHVTSTNKSSVSLLPNTIHFLNIIFKALLRTAFYGGLEKHKAANIIVLQGTHAAH